MSVKRGGLGKNLSALLGSSHAKPMTTISKTEVSEATHTDINIIRLSLKALNPGQYQPRRMMEQEPLQELADSIKQQGLLQPILVRKLVDDRYEIIAGERRFRASQLAGLDEIPVILHQVDDETTMAMALVENLQREDLNPIDQARAMSRLSHEFSLTHQEIAQILSKSRASVSNFLRLLSLSADVIQLVEKGQLDMGHARSLLTLDEEEQREAAKQVVAKNLSVRNTEELVAKIKENGSNKDKFKSKKTAPNYPLTLQTKINDLAKRLDTKIKVKQDVSGKGSLVIPYDSVDALENILKLL